MSDNVRRDPSAPRLGVSQLVSVREFHDEPVLWVCTEAKYSELSHVQLRCPIHGDHLMVRGEKT